MIGMYVGVVCVKTCFCVRYVVVWCLVCCEYLVFLLGCSWDAIADECCLAVAFEF